MHRNLFCLIVDDEEPSRLIIMRNLDLLNVDYDFAKNGIEAIEKLKENRFDFVLMDISMPGPDGMEAVRWIRNSSDDYHKNLPIFALTSYSGEERTEEILDAGMTEHMTKPFDVVRFKEIIKKYLEVTL
ncbi:MAG: response regulator [Cyclobacteriaceae bacterium]|nr:response regulator [Cyclobacteriaceae bacterium]